MRTYLVFGGAGFLGSHIVEALLRRGEKSIHVYDLETDEFSGVKYFKGDIADEARILEVLKQVQPDIVFHSVSPRFESSAQVHHRVNVEGTRVLLKACQKAKVTKLVYTSSTTVVWTGDDFDGVAEKDVNVATQHSHDAYHHTKALAECLVLEQNGVDGLFTTVLRPCGMIGERDTQLMWRLARALSDGQQNIQIGDNKNLVDFMYAGNAADAHLLAADCFLNEPEKVAGEAFFITNGSPLPQWSFNRMIYRELGDDGKKRIIKIPFTVALVLAFIVEIFCKITGRKAEFNRFAVRFLCATQWFNIEKARTRLGYEPQVSLAEGVERGVKWWKATGESQFESRKIR